MMFNEFFLLIHATIIAITTILALRISVSALIALISVECVLMNLLVTKQISLFGFNATATDAYAVGITLGLNLLQEYAGKKITRHTIIISFCAGLYATLMTQMHLWYTPSLFDTQHIHAYALFQAMPRIIIASFATYLIVQYVDYLLFASLKTLFKDKHLAIRTGISLLASQLLDTVLFSFLGLYGIITSISSIIIVSYTIKMCAIGICIPLVALLKPLLKHYAKPV